MWLLAISLVGLLVVVVCVFLRFSKDKGLDGIVNEKKRDKNSAPRVSASGEDGTKNEQVEKKSDPSGGLGEENEKTNSESKVLSVPSDQNINKTLPVMLPSLELRKYDENETPGKVVNRRLLVSTNEMKYGRNGYEVFQGVYGRRSSVAVKCLDLAHTTEAFIQNEIDNHCLCDDHSNIIRFHGLEQDQSFAYICLEPWKCSLDDLIKLSVRRTKRDTQAVAPVDDLEKVMKRIKFWKEKGKPLPLTPMLKLMRDVVCGLAHLHKLKTIHRNLNPQNVLIIVKDMTLTAKISDMSLSKHLGGKKSSYKHLATCSGSSGWQAPEQLNKDKKKKEDFPADMFNFGCLLHYAVMGTHPFGSPSERDTNIKTNNKTNLSLVTNLEAINLIEQLLNYKPDLRPSATQVLLHPLFWDSEKRLFFLREASDRIELDITMWGDLNKTIAPRVLGESKDWASKLGKTFITHIENLAQAQPGQESRQYNRSYKYWSLRHLLRLIRNILSHHREILDDPKIKEMVGKVPEGLDIFFTARFPNLMMEIYAFISMHCKGEEAFEKYFN
ncbi:putative protein kinase [Arabidopsis thaliana]|uniref:Inactive serine/threonine-protein kinase/endoribonuclease IRE1-like n=1 Tax=Arabidopsis thaliana TaxID=3702 RepID=IRE1L_ARATH|nr:Endoribonuclease/protein kinase IRE1-like protein [Arabidopsis thaliana]Q9SF12.1 RecName: Full=Inactive serine/threonine-protein kinase/endoribonuclease IRE1-like; AltName: Full=Endoplasmic reticulum-to-nucleus signaling 1-like; AltName: Full=Inositol-requiring protein 1-like; Flags: Precursor [Arabidopsis thaliana]AAF23203.1 putative protein kinase [Arabidopsis thaliana]AEE75111.1 Endoribonuclease/protein kinase IRE1-like protein [Arabidopsis thaliana]|eukprot:NP_187793.1 Endoribonuclease/protein kinase IRE1-like protein [Arabidopsis thaliana]